jgi:cytochrome c-type biogenesis protein CcmF
MYFLAVVLIGTIYPIFLDVLTSQKISVGPPFYHKLIIPFLIPFLLAMAIGPKLNWIKSNLQNKSHLLLLFAISLILSFLIIRILEISFLVNTILFTSAFYLFFITLRDFFHKKYRNLSQIIAHFSFSILILSILFNNIFSLEVITNLKIKETYQSQNLKINFESIEQETKQNFKAIRGKFIVEDQSGLIEVMKPELRIYNQPNIVTSEADIKTNIFSDKFMTMNYVQNQDYFNVRYQVKPFMIWIWISTVLLCFSGCLSLIRKKYEN